MHARWQRQDDFDVYLMPIQWMGAPEGLNDEDEWDELLEFFDEENAAAPRMPLSKHAAAHRQLEAAEAADAAVRRAEEEEREDQVGEEGGGGGAAMVE